MPNDIQPTEAEPVGQEGAPKALPTGEYAIIELLGHTTLVGRIAEAERFGAKMLVIEPLFNGELLEPVYQSGASLYRITPCSPTVAAELQHTQAWQLPQAIRVTIPAAALPAPAERGEEPPDDESDDEAELPFLMPYEFKPGDRVQFCPVVLSVDGDELRLVTHDGQHLKVWNRFVQPVEPAPDVAIQARISAAEKGEAWNERY